MHQARSATPGGRNKAAVSYPWQDTGALEEQLRAGHLSVAMALAHVGAVTRDTLKVLEDHVFQEAQLNLERKNKFERLEKLVNDLGEKCQGMQQALLYKEEKYEEKCREVARYKVICELSAKEAVKDSIYFEDGPTIANLNPRPAPRSAGARQQAPLVQPRQQQPQQHQPKPAPQQVSLPPPAVPSTAPNNDHSFRPQTPLVAAEQSQSNVLARASEPRPGPFGESAFVYPDSRGRMSLSHAKFNSLDLERASTQTAFAGWASEPASPTKSAAANDSNNLETDAADDELAARRAELAAYYAGGPTRRVQNNPQLPSLDPDVLIMSSRGKIGKMNEQISTIGGVHSTAGATIESGPVPIHKLYRQDDPNDDHKRIRISVAGQSNQVMSSSRNMANQTKQKFTQQAPHRQIASGSHVRLSSRRKKLWPF